MSSINRRQFMRLGLDSGIVYLASGPLSQAFAAARLFTTGTAIDNGPLRAVTGPFTNGDFNGDDASRPHDRLWNLTAYIASKGGRPAVSERRDVVVIGGGISGLSSAYLLQSKRPLLLEQDSQFGGNSRGEVYGGTPFAIGAAYITVPEPGSSIHRMLQATGALSSARVETEAESRIFMRGHGFQSLWNGEADPANAAAIHAINEDFSRILSTAYPTIPWKAGGISRAALDQLDRVSFAQWLTQRYGANIPASLLEYFQIYCWSSLGGSCQEVSAAQALNFISAETEGVMAFPGGNAFLGQAMYASLQRTIGADSLRSGHLVLEVRTSADGVNILVETPQGALQTIAAKAAVVTAPKYVARYIVPEMTAIQQQTVQKMRYRGYVVANLLLSTPVAPKVFDSFVLEGKVPPAPSFNSPPTRAFTDVAFANWAMAGRGRSILSVYRPYPYEGARNTLMTPTAAARVRAEVNAGLTEILKSLNLPPTAVEGIRLTRWGHAMPLAEPGFLANHSDEVFKQPTAGRIFYANQDNDANPAFETAFANAEIAATSALRLLGGAAERGR